VKRGRLLSQKKYEIFFELKAGDKVIFLVEKNNEIVVHKAGGKGKKLSEILENHKPWKMSSVEFQRKIRKEWQ
jgi:bifunctional DNA-binding transcriptional regulator/antitoxin component of YhaV-PrlF toxin-antitoxin module